MAARLEGIILVLTHLCLICEALQCYKCTHIRLHKESSTIGLKKNVLDTDCEFNPSHTEECLPGESCGFLCGRITSETPIFGKMNARFVARRCVKADGADGCIKKGNKKMVKNLIPGTRRACFCNSDRCDANICEGGYWRKGTCIAMVPWWKVAAGVTAGLVLLLCIVCVICMMCRGSGGSGGGSSGETYAGLMN